MDPDEASVPRPAAAPGDRLERLSASARGWHTIQMAVLGFIGICGVSRPQAARLRAQSNGWPPRWRSPRWRSRAWQSSPSAGSLIPPVTPLTATALQRAALPGSALESGSPS